MDAQAIRTAATSSPEIDAGLRCPRCEYNLTGLPQPRCPECGETFSWEEVRLAAANRPHIYFERVRGWRKVPGFFVTWATVLFAPWIFARQVVRRVGTCHALAFGVVCFASAFVAMFSGADKEFMATWLTTAVVYLVIQAVLLSVLDFSGWRQPLRTLRFWALVGGYTSAVMMTEFAFGPPPVLLSEVWEVSCGGSPESWADTMWEFCLPGVVLWTQVVLWLIGLGCIYFARLRRRHRSVALMLSATLLTTLCVFVLYAAVYQHIGLRLGYWLYGP